MNRLMYAPETVKGVDWSTVKRVHLIGIGGIGISALARLLHAQGFVISGTEDNQSPETLDALRGSGVPISLDLSPSAVPQADLYIYSDAWLNKHPDVLEAARRREIPVLSYFEALGSIANRFKVIAVSGAHGKTTTTAMLTDVLEAAGLDPSAVVGSLRAKTKSNYRAGKGEYFVVEADEYRRHFLQFTPHILIITNIDADHLDYYQDLADIQLAFRELALKIPADGFLVCDTGNPNVRPIAGGLSCTVVDYKKYLDPVLPLRVLPLHRINAAAVLAVVDILKIPQETARKALAEFSGTWRRFEYKGKTEKGADVYDDYGHHPTEVAATLRSVREQFPGRKLLVAFHPHLYSRTKKLLNEFASAFGDADDIVIAPIFAAREEPDPFISNHVLADRIIARGKNARALDSFEEIEAYLDDKAASGDLIVTMGAGDIYKVAEQLTARKE